MARSTWACSTRASFACAYRGAALARGGMTMAYDERTRGFLHVRIPSPAPPPGYDDELSTPSANPKSVTHVRGPKCHLCPHSFTGRFYQRFGWDVMTRERDGRRRQSESAN